MKPVGKEPTPGGLRFGEGKSVRAAAEVLVQHTITSQDGTVTVGNVARSDLLAIRREDWARLYEALNS